MTKFICTNLINGKLTFAKVKASKTYSPHIDEVVVELEVLGYKIDEDGNCVKIPTEE